MKAWNWPLVLYLASGLFNALFHKHSGAAFKLVRAVGFDPINILDAVRGLFAKEVPVPVTIDVPEDEEPTPAQRVSQVPTRKQSVFVKKDGPDSN